MKAVVAFVLAFIFISCAAYAVTVTGKVRSSDGKAVAGAEVYAIVFAGPEGPKVAVKTVSKEDGSFKMDIQPLEAGCLSCTLAARTEDGYFGWSDSVDWDGKKNKSINAVIYGSQVGEYRGKVTTENGKPLPGVKVSPELFYIRDAGFSECLLGVDMIKPVMQFSAAVTDEQGVYILKSIPKIAGVEVKAEKAGYAMKQGHDVDSDSGNLVLVPAGKIRGKVLEVNGKPAAHTQVVAVAISGSFYYADTAKDGAYVFDLLPPGVYHIILKSDDSLVVIKRNVKAAAGRVTRIANARAAKRMILTGKVIDAETQKPIPGVSINISELSKSAVEIPMIPETDEKGTFRIGLAPGKYKIKPYFDPGMSLDNSLTVNVDSKGNNNVLIKLKKPSMGGGTVLDENDKPVADASVYTEIILLAVKTDLNGKFEIALPSKKDTVTFDGTQLPYIEVVAMVPQLNVGTVERIDRDILIKRNAVLHLKPLHTLSVTVTNKAGVPLPGVKVQVWRRMYNSAMTDRGAVTDAKGKVSFQLCNGGTYYCAAGGDGFYDPDEGETPDPNDNIAVGLPDWKSEITLVLSRRQAKSGERKSQLSVE